MVQNSTIAEECGAHRHRPTIALSAKYDYVESMKSSPGLYVKNGSGGEAYISLEENIQDDILILSKLMTFGIYGTTKESHIQHMKKHHFPDGQERYNLLFRSLEGNKIGFAQAETIEYDEDKIFNITMVNLLPKISGGIGSLSFDLLLLVALIDGHNLSSGKTYDEKAISGLKNAGLHNPTVCKKRNYFLEEKAYNLFKNYFNYKVDRETLIIDVSNTEPYKSMPPPLNYNRELGAKKRLGFARELNKNDDQTIKDNISLLSKRYSLSFVEE